MTMQRSEYTDPDSSRRFPVVSSTSRSLISAGATVDPATELSGQAAGPATAAAAAAATASATATDACHADVLSGRGKSYTKHYGNLRFDDIIKQNLRRYFSVATHTEKKMITEEIVDDVTKMGRFLRYDKSLEKWIVMDREAARIKVAQALQYRQRRVAKGLESIDDSLEPNPLPPSHQGLHGVQHNTFQPISEGSASMLSQDVLLGLSQHSDGSQLEQQQPGHGEWGAIHRHHQQHQQQQQQLQQLQQQQQRPFLQRPNLTQQQHQHQQPSFDYDNDTSIGVAVVHRQMEQQQRDQQILSHQLEDLLGQRRVQNLQNTSAGHLAAAGTGGPVYNVTGGGPQFSDLGHLAAIELQLSNERNGHTSTHMQEQRLQPLLGLSLAALEPRPLLFANDVAVTGVPSGFGSTTQPTGTLAAQSTYHQSFRPIRSPGAGSHQRQYRPEPTGPGQHHHHLQAMMTLQTTSQQPAAASVAATAAAAVHHKQQEEDSNSDTSLAELLTEDVEDDPLDAVAAWDEPAFGDRHGS